MRALKKSIPSMRRFRWRLNFGVEHDPPGRVHKAWSEIQLAPCISLGPSSSFWCYNLGMYGIHISWFKMLMILTHHFLPISVQIKVVWSITANSTRQFKKAYGRSSRKVKLVDLNHKVLDYSCFMRKNIISLKENNFVDFHILCLCTKIN